MRVTHILLKLAVPFLFFALLAVPFFANAQACPATGLVPCGTAGCPCQFCHVSELTRRIIHFLMWEFALPLAVLLFVIAGIMMLVSGASPARRMRGKSVFTATIIGFAIALLSWVVVNTVVNVLADSSVFPWPWHSPPTC